MQVTQPLWLQDQGSEGTAGISRSVPDLLGNWQESMVYFILEENGNNFLEFSFYFSLQQFLLAAQPGEVSIGQSHKFPWTEFLLRLKSWIRNPGFSNSTATEQVSICQKASHKWFSLGKGCCLGFQSLCQSGFWVAIEANCGWLKQKMTLFKGYWCSQNHEKYGKVGLVARNNP